jgi:hypothetical protein
MTNLTTVKEAIAKGITQSQPQRPTGCGRVYVEIKTGCSIDELFKLSKKERKAVEKRNKGILPIIESAVIGTGMKWIDGRIYVGYDNNFGNELGKGESIAQSLTSAGIPAYMVAEAD